MENLKQLVQDGLAGVANADNLQALDHIRVEYLGKKGRLPSRLKHWANSLAMNVPLPVRKSTTPKAR